MIISIRGTSGAGKSHLARVIFEQYHAHRPVMTERRRHPLYVLHERLVDLERRVLMVPGHYEIPNGGVDTLGTLEETYGLVRWGVGQGYDVLMEGKCMSDGAARIVGCTVAGIDCRVVHITTPVDQCVEGVRSRGHKISPQSIQRTYDRVLRDVQRIREEGVTVFSGDRAQCRSEIEKWLDLKPREIT